MYDQAAADVVREAVGAAIFSPFAPPGSWHGACCSGSMLQLEASPTYGARTALALLDADAEAPRLTAAEQHVLTLMLDGCDNQTIATERGTSARTIANQVSSLLRKFKLCSRAELAARASGFLRADILRDWQVRAGAIAAGLAQVTPRQRLALSLRARGHSIKFISFELGIAMSTVSAELKLTRRKLDIRSSLELCAVFGQIDPQAAA